MADIYWSNHFIHVVILWLIPYRHRSETHSYRFIHMLLLQTFPYLSIYCFFQTFDHQPSYSSMPMSPMYIVNYFCLGMKLITKRCFKLYPLGECLLYCLQGPLLSGLECGGRSPHLAFINVLDLSENQDWVSFIPVLSFSLRYPLTRSSC